MRLDLIIAIVLLWAIYTGFRKGLIIQLFSLIALFLGIYGAIKFSGIVSDYLTSKNYFDGKPIPIISFTATFIIIVILVQIIARIIEKFVELIELGLINRIFGAIFSIVKYMLILSVILVILKNFNINSKSFQKEEGRSSILYKPVLNFAPLIYPYFRNNFLQDRSKLNHLIYEIHT